MSLSNNFPTIRPSLNLDFANVKALDPRITFTRTTTATYYDGKTTAKAEENLLLQSQDFTTTWGTVNATVTANTVTAPDGTTTADTIDEGIASGNHHVGQNLTTAASTTYAYSCFLKAGTAQYATLSINSLGTNTRWAAIRIDLTGGTITATDGAGGGTVTSSSIVSVGNSWYRCVLTGDIGTSTDMRAIIGVANDGTTFSAANRGLDSYTGTSRTIYAWGAQLEQRSAVSSYTATTTQPITNYIPVLQTAASGVARFDHNPTTGESLGLLIEEQRSNLLLRSEDFSTNWPTTRASITSNTIVAPDGTLTGDQLVENTDNNTHIIEQTSISFTSGTTYTVSVYAKHNGRFLQLTFGTGAFSSAPYANFNLSTGVVSASGGGGTATITSVGNGWYRCTLTATASTTATATFFMLLSSSGTAARFLTSYTGDGYKGVFLWGAQLEAGAFPTSYIATTSASVTRNADAASMTGTNFSSWFNQAEGAVYCDGSQEFGGSYWQIDAGASSDRFFLFRSSTTASTFRTTVSSSNVISLAQTQSSSAKTVSAYKTGDSAYTNSGVTPTTSSVNYSMPLLTSLRIGSFNASVVGQAYIRKLSYYPSRLSDAQLQALTT